MGKPSLVLYLGCEQRAWERGLEVTFHKILLMKVQLYKMIPTHYVSKDNHLHVVGRSITIVQQSTTLILFGLMSFHCGNASVFPSLSYKMRHDTMRASARVVSDAFYKTKSERPKH